ncbi:MAG: PilT/PilU family type 4a pilus ATPase [Phycisphaerales bacterium]|nr:PilT/PilU family type 4a pilus ATPase [Phycisphaerales bacterium]
MSSIEPTADSLESGDGDSSPGGRPRIARYFEAMIRAGGSDLHFKADAPPRVRHRGGLKVLTHKALSNEKIERMVFEIMSDVHKEWFAKKGSSDFSYQLDADNRFRINIFRQRGATSMAARHIPKEIKNYNELHLPPQMETIAQKHQGLILVAGITGSGKSTTIAAMIDQINRTRTAHIITLEDPIEFMYEDKKSFINQREIGQDVNDFHDALKYLMREDPDVVLIGELRDPETFEAALRAAESGHLVFGTVHASNAAGTITRVLELFPEHSRDLIRTSLEFNLQAIVCLKLLKGIRPDIPRIPAVEVMIANATVRKLIREKRENEILGVIRNSYHEGMQDFTESLRVLVEKEFIATQTAYEVAPNPEELKMRLKGISVSAGGIIG